MVAADIEERILLGGSNLLDPELDVSKRRAGRNTQTSDDGNEKNEPSRFLNVVWFAAGSVRCNEAECKRRPDNPPYLINQVALARCVDDTVRKVF